MADREGDFRLPVRIDEIFLNPHLGVMADEPLDHGCDLGIRETLELGVDADSVGLDMPVDEDPSPPVP